MALIGNRNVLQKSVCFYIGGQTCSGDRSNYNKSGAFRNWGVQTGLDWRLAAVPYGYSAGGAWALPRRVGAMVARRTAIATSSQVGSASAGLPGTGLAAALAAQALDGFLRANMDGSASAQASQSATLIGVFASTGVASAQSSQIATLIALLNGSGTATAQTEALGDGVLAVAMTGTASAIASALATLSSTLQGGGLATAVASGVGTLIGVRSGGGVASAQSASAASLGAVGFMYGTLTAGATGAGAMYAIGYMTGSTIDNSILTVDAIVNGVIAGFEDQTLQVHELWQKEGLDPTKPVTHTPSSIKIGNTLNPDIEISLSGNRKTLTTLDRVP